MQVQNLLRNAIILAPLVLSLPASAQSSVTVFGVADLGIRHVSSSAPGSNLNTVESGANTTSRLGFKGVEDMGGGLKAGFHLESGTPFDTGLAGSNNMVWDRRSTVSLMGTNFGELRIGRDRVITHVYFSDLEPFNYTGIAKASNLQTGGAGNIGPIRSAMGATASGLNGLTRSNNMIQYYTPTIAGVQLALMGQFRENGTAVNGYHKSYGARVTYENGPVRFGIGSQKVSNDITAGKSLQDTVAGGGYNFGVVEITAAVRRWTFASSKQTNLLLGAEIPVGQGRIRASVIRANLAGTVGTTNIDANDATQFGIGYEHSLSKRTALYANYARLSNKGNQTFTVSPATTPGGSSSGLDVGIQHKF